MLMSVSAFSQKTSTGGYKAVNGITYNVGDIVKLGNGSGTNGAFLYLQLGGWAAVAGYNSKEGQDQLNIGRGYANTQVTIKKIRQGRVSGVNKYYFVVDGGNISNYNLVIDDAIFNCEVLPCKQPASNKEVSKADELIKLKKLLDDGVISKEEFDKEKAKLLGSQR